MSKQRRRRCRGTAGGGRAVKRRGIKIGHPVVFIWRGRVRRGLVDAAPRGWVGNNLWAYQSRQALIELRPDDEGLIWCHADDPEAVKALHAIDALEDDDRTAADSLRRYPLFRTRKR